MTDNSKTAGCRVKLEWTLGLWANKRNIYMGYLDWPFSVQGHFGVIRCTCLKLACKSKMGVCRAKLIEISKSWVWCYIYIGYLDFLVLKVTLVILISNWPVTRKWLAVEQNGLNLWLGGAVVWLLIWDSFDLLVLKVILGSFSALVAKWPITWKRLAVEQNGVKFGTLG